MINVREFIKKLGDKAPDFFGTKDVTVARWLKTGNIPFKAVEKVLAAEEALNMLHGAPRTEVTHTAPVLQPATPTVEEGSDIDPLTHLPANLDRKLPQINAAPGHAPQVIEMSPTEQNWGLNLTRPGRPAITQPFPPMKIRKVNGQDVPYVEQPAPIRDLPPEMGDGGAGWSNRGEPIPQPKKENERPIAPKQAEAIPTEKV